MWNKLAKLHIVPLTILAGLVGIVFTFFMVSLLMGIGYLIFHFSFQFLMIWLTVSLGLISYQIAKSFKETFIKDNK